MAWRIDRAVIRGEIDNRTRGRVTGRLWLHGLPDPLELELHGDCLRDLAGRRLEFTNPRPEPADLAGFAPRQRGRAGDITASRKVRIPDLPPDQIGAYYAARKPFPSRWGNALYLEWFSERNGRVVIEAADFELRLTGEAAWEMTEAEETRQRQAATASMEDFLTELGAGIDDGAATPSEGEAEADDATEDADAPGGSELEGFSEEEAERALARSELLTDRIAARLARAGDNPDLEQIIAEELERLRLELGKPEPTAEQLASNAEPIDELAPLADEAVADSEALLGEDRRHPLAERAFELCLDLDANAEANHWIPADALEEHPVADLVSATERAAVKLAGALNGEWPPQLFACGSIIARLKRARIYLDDALRATESCNEEKLIPPSHLGPILVDLIDLAHDADELITELRDRIARGA